MLERSAEARANERAEQRGRPCHRRAGGSIVILKKVGTRLQKFDAYRVSFCGVGRSTSQRGLRADNVRIVLTMYETIHDREPIAAARNGSDEPDASALSVMHACRLSGR
jgi:hypothetical protein